MTWFTVAKKDFRDAVQSRALWALVGVFVLVSLLSTYAYVEVPEMFGSPAGATFGGLLFFTVGLTGLFVPLAAIVVCYKSLAGERELGSIKLLLSLPTSRSQVLAGKVAGRAAVLTFGLGVGLVVGLGFGSLLLGTFDAVAALTFVAVTLAFAAIYAAIIVSISATTGSTSRATTLSLGFFVVFELLWDVVPMGILYVVEGFSFPTTIPDWIFPVMQLAPSSAYFSTIVALLPDLADTVGAEPAQTGVGAEADAAGAEPFFASPEVGIAILALWLVVPLAVGYYRFDASDL
ncbi:ABC transporter permease subunit [Natronorubrum sp. JWXQ-INN-674]|uniref:ABC transporter permease subunit n=1 Tax=Natronorubrum halalkaliphilum TaxID=2691917 RepID=A0A6B0VSX7_9EURY|nr:ABC transporter permease subunit [Natronorubrum halalkaliphilum]MXV64514.1 ABC transporter permease subunit [Natronorubrum halalkaliphilum]